MDLNMPTHFSEANALLFIQSSQEDRAKECLEDSSRIEIILLANAAYRLYLMCTNMSGDGRQ